MSACDPTHVAVLLVAALSVVPPPNGVVAPSSAPLSPAMMKLADRCKRVALENVDEEADPAFQRHVPTYVPQLRSTRGGDKYIEIEFYPPEEKRSYETGFSCIFEGRLDPEPLLDIWVKMTSKRPPFAELHERCLAGAVKKASGLAAGLSSYMEQDQVPLGDAAVTIYLRPPAAKAKHWAAVSCHLAAPWWAPEVTFLSSASDGGAALTPVARPTR